MKPFENSRKQHQAKLNFELTPKAQTASNLSAVKDIDTLRNELEQKRK